MSSTNLAYIECAGVRVPANWTVEQLRTALAKRSIRFATKNEEEILRVFGEAIGLKASLEKEILQLQSTLIKLKRDVERKKKLRNCPGCGVRWTVKPITIPAGIGDKDVPEPLTVKKQQGKSKAGPGAKRKAKGG